MKWPRSSEARQALAAIELIAEGADILQDCYAILTQSEVLEITPEVNEAWGRLINWRSRVVASPYLDEPGFPGDILQTCSSLLGMGLAASAVCRQYMDDGRGFGDEWSNDGEFVKERMRTLWHLDPEWDGPFTKLFQAGKDIDPSNWPELPLPEADAEQTQSPNQSR